MADHPEAWVPEVGQVVRVTEVAPYDGDPSHALGDCFITEEDGPGSCFPVYHPEQGDMGYGWLYVDHEVGSGTWCRLEPIDDPALEARLRLTGKP